MVSISVKVFVGGGVLQHAGDGAQDVTLLRLQGGAGGPLHHIETVWSHDSRVHVAIVDQVTDNLRAVTQTGSDITALIWFKTKVFLFFFNDSYSFTASVQGWFSPVLSELALFCLFHILSSMFYTVKVFWSAQTIILNELKHLRYTLADQIASDDIILTDQSAADWPRIFYLIELVVAGCRKFCLQSVSENLCCVT